MSNIDFVKILHYYNMYGINYNKFSTNTLSSILNTPIYIFCDGGVKNNGKPNSIGAYSVYFHHPEYHEFNITEEVQKPTNNKAELSGIRKICEILHNHPDIFKDKEIIICSDSNYSIKCVTVWYKRWQTNNWQTANKEPVKNKEIIEQIINILDIIPVSFKHIYSHKKEPSDKNTIEWLLWNGNNIVDTNITNFMMTFCP
jgi:ribonuclease HI